MVPVQTCFSRKAQRILFCFSTVEFASLFFRLNYCALKGLFLSLYLHPFRLNYRLTIETLIKRRNCISCCISVVVQISVWTFRLSLILYSCSFYQVERNLQHRIYTQVVFTDCVKTDAFLEILISQVTFSWWAGCHKTQWQAGQWSCWQPGNMVPLTADLW